MNSALPPQRHRPDTQVEHQDPVSQTAQKKREKKRKKERKARKKKEEERKKKIYKVINIKKSKNY